MYFCNKNNSYHVDKIILYIMMLMYKRLRLWHKNQTKWHKSPKFPFNAGFSQQSKYFFSFFTCTINLFTAIAHGGPQGPLLYVHKY